MVSCQKSDNVIIGENQAPSYSGISTLKVENYIQRLFIDLLGREPTEMERDSFVLNLKEARLRVSYRDSMIHYLQMDTGSRMGDSSYRHAYINRVYELMKFRLIEGASDPEIAENLGNIRFAIEIYRLNGDSISVARMQEEEIKYLRVLNWKYLYNKGLETYPNLISYLMRNTIYDVINMGSFNFINAAFDDVLGRMPHRDEFELAFDIVEKNEPRSIFQKVAQNKSEFIQALLESDAFYESQVRNWYFQYLRREVPPKLLWELTTMYKKTERIDNVQRVILSTDEYAQFN